MKESEKAQFPEKNIVFEKVCVMYDDPYEESPLIPLTLSSASTGASLHQQQLQTVVLPQSHLHCSSSAENDRVDSSNEKFKFTYLDKKTEDLSRRYAPKDIGIEECTKKMQQITATDFIDANIQSHVPVSSPKFYQLSAEYGGIENENGDGDDADGDDANSIDDSDGDVGNYTELQEECERELYLARNLETISGYQSAKMPPVATHCIVSHLFRECEEPWDLSIMQRSNEDKMRVTDPISSKRFLGDSLSMSCSKVSNSRSFDRPMKHSCHIESSKQENSIESMKNKTQESPVQASKDLSSSFPVYGVPWNIKSKFGKRDIDAALKSHIAMGNYATSSCGIRISKMNVPVPVPVRSSSLRPVDSRPMEDYDEPWDQKGKVLCKAAKGAKGSAVSFTNANSSNLATNCAYSSWSSTLADQIDMKLPLEKQPWYHANISRLEAENLLCVHHEGSYLIRNSESSTKDFSLSVKSAHGFMHMKIVVNADDCFVLGQFSQPFHSIAQMLLHYTTHKLPIKGAEHMSLFFPVPKRI